MLYVPFLASMTRHNLAAPLPIYPFHPHSLSLDCSPAVYHGTATAFAVGFSSDVPFASF